jgi:hypothetical protein
MTTRHTVSHADELYAGNVYKDGYSPDGRRGIKMTHLYAHEFLSTAGVPALAGDADGILSSYATPSLIGPTGAVAANFIGLCTGALTSNGATIIEFDVPRNLTFVCCGNSTGVYLKVIGLDQYGDAMAETIQGASQTAVASGQRCFKSIHTLYSTAKFPDIVTLGTGNRLGLPFHLADVGKLVAASAGGVGITVSGVHATAIMIPFIGASSATTISTVNGNPDVRGSIKFIAPALDGSTRFTALMVVDHTTSRKAFGPPQVTACSNGVG